MGTPSGGWCAGLYGTLSGGQCGPRGGSHGHVWWSKLILFLCRDASFPLQQRLHIFLPPIAHLQQDRLQAFAEVGKRIFDLGGHFAVDVAVNDAVFLQFAQLQREHALGNAGQQALQFAKAFFAQEEME